MGLLSNIQALNRGNWAPEDDRWYFPGGSLYGGFPPTESGVSVNSDTAMRLMTVQNCVRVRAFTISQLPCHIMRQKGRMKERATDFYLYEKLHDQPNSWMTAPEFWAMAEAHICLRGNFYVYKLGIDNRPVQELIPLGPDRVQEIIQNNDYSLTYRVRVGKTYRATAQGGYSNGTGGEIIEIPGSKIVHFRGLTLDGVIGTNPIEYARETIGLGMASAKFLSRYFGKGMHPGAVLKHPLSLSATAHANLRENLKKKYEGLGKSHEFMLLDEAMDITFPEIKLVDAQYIEQMKMNEAQICGLFRVPLMLIQSGDKTPTYASAEQFMLSYTMYGVTPDCVNYEKTIRRDLLTPKERREYFAKFSVEGLLRGDFKTRMQGYQIGINSEIFSPNEAREREDLNPYDGGDEYRTRTSTVKNQDQSKGDEKE